MLKYKNETFWLFFHNSLYLHSNCKLKIIIQVNSNSEKQYVFNTKH